jgi:hypothetical protein
MNNNLNGILTIDALKLFLLLFADDGAVFAVTLNLYNVKNTDTATCGFNSIQMISENFYCA